MRAMFVVAALGLATAAPAQAQVEPEYFKLPAGVQTQTTGLAVDGAGAVYFGAQSGADALLGRLDPSQLKAGTTDGVTTIPTPARTLPGSGAILIRDVVYDPQSKHVFFTRSDGKVGRWDGNAATAVTLSHNLDLWGAAPAPGGGVWVAEHGARNAPNWEGNRLSRVTANLDPIPGPNLAFQAGYDEFHYDAKAKGVASAPDGTPWFVQADLGHGYRITSMSGSNYIEYRPPGCVVPEPQCSGKNAAGPSLYDITVAPDGAVWYTNGNTNSVGRLMPGGTASEYKLATMDPALASALPTAIMTSPDGSIWVGTGDSPYVRQSQNALVQIDPVKLTSKVYKTGATIAPMALGADAKGNVYFTGSSATPQIGRLMVGTATAPIVDPPVGGETPNTPIAPVVQPGPPAVTLTPAVTVRAEITQFRVSGDTVSANQICVGPPSDPCSLVYLLQTHEYVKGFPGVKKSAAPKPTTIGKATVRLMGGQSKKVTITLNAKGKKLRKKLKSFKATLTVTQTVKGAKKPKQVLKKNVTFKR